MAKSLEAWKNQVYNTVIDMDSDDSADCVDVSKSWIMYVTGKGWQECAGWGNAKDIYYYWSKTYLDRIPRGNAPQLGDIVCMDGTIGGGYGHTGVVVAINGSNITIYQENTFTQQPVYTGTFNAYSSYIIGFMRPNGNAPFTVGAAPATQGFQRVASYAAKYRDAANSGATLLQTFTAGETYDFKGFVHGESVDGNDIWFVGRYTGGYVWSGAFTDTGTHDLPDITPANVPALLPYQRQVGNSVINYRKLPEVQPDNVIKTFNPGDVLDFDAWTKGALVDATNVWFRGKYTGGWSHAGGFTDRTTHDLPEVVLTVTPAPPAVYPAPTKDPLVTKVYNKKHPLDKTYAPTDLVDAGGGQTLRKEAADSLALMRTQQNIVSASGYRSYATQEKVYADEVASVGKEQADRESARPGFSEHQSGLAMDFGPIDQKFENSAAWIWLVANGYKYGWILRYTAPKESVTGYMSEPWHWRYVGVDVATDMHNKGVLTLEEYFNVEGGDYATSTPPVDPVPTPEPTPDPTPEPDPNDPTKNPLFAIFEAIVKFFSDIINKLKKK